MNCPHCNCDLYFIDEFNIHHFDCGTRIFLCCEEVIKRYGYEFDTLYQSKICENIASDIYRLAKPADIV